jgi:hypothetical protein
MRTNDPSSDKFGGAVRPLRSVESEMNRAVLAGVACRPEHVPESRLRKKRQS